MRGSFTEIAILTALFAFILMGGGVLVWLSPVAAGQITPAQANLMDLADTMVKGSIGAIFGFAGSRLALRLNGAKRT